MVIRDDDTQSNSNSLPAGDAGAHSHAHVNTDLRSASPLDRFASGVIDYLIVAMPFVYLILAPFERITKETALYSDQASTTFTTVFAVLSGCSFIILYQSLLIWAWGGTVGQLILGLRVRSIWADEKIRLSQAFLRATLWGVSWLMLGVPLLAIFSNRLRRPFHDRVADTYVISTRSERAVKAPTLRESALIRSLMWALCAMLVFVLGNVVVSSFRGFDQQKDLISTLESEDTLCELVSEAQADWPQKNEAPADRLSVAMSLFAAGAIDRKCLQAEVENLHKLDEAGPGLYLVKSFVYSDRPELSDKYLDRVCSRFADSPECHMSVVIRAVADEDWDTMQSEFEHLKKSGLVYPAIWAVKQYLRHEDYQSAEVFLDEIPDSRALSEFINPSRAKILWALNRRDEASGVESVAYSTLGVESKLELSSYMCFEKIWFNCDAASEHSCETFSKIANGYDDVLGSTEASLAFLRLYECKGGANPNYEKILNFPLNENVKALAAALNSPGTDGFTDLLDEADTSGPFAAEVSRRLVERAKSVSLLKQLEAEWRDRPATRSWQKVGATLFRKFYDMHEYKLGTEVADLMNSQIDPAPANKNLFEKFIVSAFKSGDVEHARVIFARYEKYFPMPVSRTSSSTDQLRMTASEDPFQVVVRSLRGGGL